jgi:hypothetical protein
MDALVNPITRTTRLGTLAAASLVILSLSGCRFGNQVVKAADPTEKSGFYRSEAATMTLCAFLDGQPAQCAAAPLSLVPDSITEVMTNPVYVAANSAQSKAYLLPNSLDTSAAFEMTMDSSGQLAGIPFIDEPQQLWVDPSCLSQVQIEKAGLLRGADASTPGAIGDFKISGSVDFTLAVLTALGDHCGSTLSLMQGCHTDTHLCPGATLAERQEEQLAIQDFFAPYIAHGVLTLDQLPSLQGLGWEVSYQ